MVREPLTEPLPVGLKRTEIAQLFFGRTDPPHALVWVKARSDRDSRDAEGGLTGVAERYGLAGAGAADGMFAEAQARRLDRGDCSRSRWNGSGFIDTRRSLPVEKPPPFRRR